VRKSSKRPMPSNKRGLALACRRRLVQHSLSVFPFWWRRWQYKRSSLQGATVTSDVIKNAAYTQRWTFKLTKAFQKEKNTW